MSFLDGNDDVVTLEEALAFIDSLDMEDSPASASSYDINLNNSPAQDCPTARGIVSTIREKHKKRKRSNLSSSTRLHQRKKAEVLYLRRRAQELEANIEKLTTKRGINSTTIVPSMTNDWIKIAQNNFQARLRSEETNRTLKSIMANQIQVSDTLRDIMQKQASFQANGVASTVTSRGNELGNNYLLNPKSNLHTTDSTRKQQQQC
ncbi:Hypothetical protein PHPALM_9623 [Phytophthora palmivora]|uniref:BZIP domain-containing protein n=1 Tax=Phytophthora palmivora TaxID=4796 RepID=A0A2P4Y6T4_9STRA|nr:Hypothetical protein PHPALM_9623 [Phytophthora palmivora]